VLEHDEVLVERVGPRLGGRERGRRYGALDTTLDDELLVGSGTARPRDEVSVRKERVWRFKDRIKLWIPMGNARRYSTGSRRTLAVSSSSGECGSRKE